MGLIHTIHLVWLVLAITLAETDPTGQTYSKILPSALVSAVVITFVLDKIKSNTLGFNVGLISIAVGQLLMLAGSIAFAADSNAAIPWLVLMSTSVGLTLPVYLPTIERLVSVTDARISSGALGLVSSTLAFAAVAVGVVAVELSNFKYDLNVTLAYIGCGSAGLCFFLLAYVVAATASHVEEYESSRQHPRQCVRT